MRYDERNITSIGERIKTEAKKRGFTNQDIADLLHYSCGKQISPFYSGKQNFSDNQIEIIARKFGLREDYLKCIDDYETEEQRLASIKQRDILSMNSTISYIQSLGYELRPYYYWICSLCDFESGIDELINYVDRSIENNELIDYIYSYRQSEEYKKGEYVLCEHRNMRVRLLSNPLYEESDKELKDINELDKNDSSYWNNISLIDCGDIIIMYEVWENGKLINYVPLNKMQCFLNLMDRQCKAAAEYLLNSETFSHDDIDV